MARREVYDCDRCHSKDTRVAIVNLMGNSYTDAAGSRSTEQEEAHWCLGCCEIILKRLASGDYDKVLQEHSRPLPGINKR